jgi:hypothetical protein
MSSISHPYFAPKGAEIDLGNRYYKHLAPPGAKVQASRQSMSDKLRPVPPHSYLNAVSGSTLVARQAGM